jgi:hypothetical protein
LKSRIFCAFGDSSRTTTCYLQTLLICQVEFQTSSRNLKLALSFHFKASTSPKFLTFGISISLSLFKFTWTKLNSTLLLYIFFTRNEFAPTPPIHTPARPPLSLPNPQRLRNNCFVDLSK